MNNINNTRLRPVPTYPSWIRRARLMIQKRLRTPQRPKAPEPSLPIHQLPCLSQVFRPLVRPYFLELVASRP